jgi:cytidylate kinase
MGVNMKKVTISGHPGSGTSTLVEGLSKQFSWASINGGQIFRNEAENRGMTLAEFGELCSNDESVDLTLDEKLRAHISDNSTNIIESRLAGWWAYKLGTNCVRIWLNVSEQERARRVTLREETTIDEAINANRARLLVDNERYQKMYGLTPDDPTPYTHIIDATHITAGQVLAEVIKILGVE